ncbi:hypothetical protein BDY19DRAFT_995895 [Irpex rosettiformis]|uniref:Uncharacterized protein n=1 Tax=Irpex rosettiformis TaxID=378272 RepID=A0ACB8TW55_9APHY|nr:hypothetical protein BDY19DRAFT_995895 [Irpex rosettiformis]
MEGLPIGNTRSLAFPLVPEPVKVGTKRQGWGADATGSLATRMRDGDDDIVGVFPWKGFFGGVFGVLDGEAMLEVVAEEVMLETIEQCEKHAVFSQPRSSPDNAVATRESRSRLASSLDLPTFVSSTPPLRFDLSFSTPSFFLTRSLALKALGRAFRSAVSNTGEVRVWTLVARRNPQGFLWFFIGVLAGFPPVLY